MGAAPPCQGPAAPLSPRRRAGFPRRRAPPKIAPLIPSPATPYREQLSIGAGRRTIAIALALLIPAILLLLLLAYGLDDEPEKVEVPLTVVRLEAAEFAQEAPAPESREQAQNEAQTAPEQPAPEQPVQPQPAEQLPAPVPPPPPVATPNAPPQPPSPPKIGVRPPNGQTYGPPNKGGSRSSGDTQRVGTAPNGEPLYAAAWYREPTDGELRGYLSTAGGPGWGLIACRTAPDYRVEDCVGLDEYPNGAQINRAVLAAAWQFRVRPPRVGGKSLVGSWVRIRIDYRTKRG